MDRIFTGTVLGFLVDLPCVSKLLAMATIQEDSADYDLEGTWQLSVEQIDLANLHGQGTWWHSRTGPAGLDILRTSTL